jgi:hypothetical protein
LKKIFKNCGLLLFFAIFLGQGHSSFAQFVEFGPIHQKRFVSRPNTPSSGRLQNVNTLPFWDDFSQGIDTLKWTLDGTSYTETIGENPPSLGAILFNGVDENGRPYSVLIGDQGESDFLTSKPFDLSLLSESERESLYLSFFWQAGGKAEAPDENDRLTLEILDSSGDWIPVWFQQGGENVDRTSFTQEIIRINPQLQHAGFQFRFYSKGRQVGPFDSWLLDYVYLNSNRDENDLTYRDRALTSPNQVNFGEFSAYPLELLQNDQTGLWTQVQNEFLNLENRFRAMEYSIQVEDSLGSLALIINDDTPFNPVPNSLERRSFLSREFDEVPVPLVESDLVFRTSLTSGDGFLFEIQNGDTIQYSSVDYRLNDTIKTSFPLRDFFAYDHGSADYSAGINQRSGQLAVRYNSPEPVFIKGISINFTNANQANQAIDIVVWDEIDRSPIFSKESLIPVKMPGQDFIYYSLDTNIRVTGEFHIGFTQFSNEFVHVGLDKINDRGDKIFYNVGGGWVQNEDVKGSLMIRPHVSRAQPFEQSELPGIDYRIYPNPVVNQLFVKGEFSEITIFDSFGRQILLPKEQIIDGEIINFDGQRPGVYVINLFSESGSKSFRILVSK